MKTLKDFISESIKINESEDSKSITFNFSGLDDAEDTLKSFEEMEYCTIEDNKLTVDVTSDNFDKLSSVQDILQQYTDKNLNSPHRSSDEQYAQKVKKFSEKMNEFNETIEKFENPETDEDDQKSKDEE